MVLYCFSIILLLLIGIAAGNIEFDPEFDPENDGLKSKLLSEDEIDELEQNCDNNENDFHLDMDVIRAMEEKERVEYLKEANLRMSANPNFGVPGTEDSDIEFNFEDYYDDYEDDEVDEDKDVFGGLEFGDDGLEFGDYADYQDYINYEDGVIEQKDNDDPQSEFITDDLVIRVIHRPEGGCDHPVEVNDTVDFNYEARVRDENGQVYDSTLREGWKSFVAKMDNRLFPAWQEGMIGMCPGEKRHLYIPSSMAFKANGIHAMYGVVPPHTPVFISVSVLSITQYQPLSYEEQHAAALEKFFSLDHNGDKIVTEEEYFKAVIGGAEENEEEAIDEKGGSYTLMKRLAQTILLFYQALKKERSSAMSIVRTVFANEDLDKDGSISEKEFLTGKLRHLEKEEGNKKKEEL